MKKVLSIIVVMVIFVFSFTGCQQNQPAEVTSDSTAGVSSQQGPESEFGSIDQPIKISIVSKNIVPTDPDTVKLVEQIEKGMAKSKQFVKIELKQVPQGSYSEKIGLLLNSGEIPDIIYFQGGDANFASQGILENLQPYIEKSTYVKNLLQSHSIECLKNYPYLLWPAPPRISVPVIRKDVFEQLPSSSTFTENPSVDNYYALMKDIKNKNSSYALTTDGSTSDIDTIFNQAFGITSTIVKDAGGKYVYSITTENEKKKLEFYSKLYKDGLLDKEFLTKTWDTKEKAFYEGQSGIISGAIANIDVYNNKMTTVNGEQSELIVLPPAKGVAQGYAPVNVTKESRGFAIASTSKNKNVAFAIFEYMASPEGRMLDEIGMEGDQYVVKDGKINFTDKFTAWYPRVFDTIKGFAPTTELAAPIKGPVALKALEENEFYMNDVNINIPDQYAAEWDATQNLYKEYSADIITGKKPISAFDEFVTKWNKAGGTKITEYANEQIK